MRLGVTTLVAEGDVVGRRVMVCRHNAKQAEGEDEVVITEMMGLVPYVYELN